ncbi:MAG: hypothetical protein FWC46_08195 [Actinomycetia bacterium]|nr:hypothetical protein [Actinomycetes bacterium]
MSGHEQGKRRGVAVAAVIGFAVGVGVWGLAFEPAAVGAPGAPSTPAAPAATATPPGQGGAVPPGWIVREVKSPVVARTCDPNAAVTAKASDSARRKESLVNNPASNPHPGAKQLPDTASAIAGARHNAASPDTARSAGWKGPKFSDPQAAAVVVPFGALAATFGAVDSIDPQRCVWVVTVQEPFVPQHHPLGVAPRVYDEYTVVVDEATGTAIFVAAGPDVPSAITGEGLQ